MKTKLYILFIWLVTVSNTFGQDIVINEIMANPKNGQLPTVEYIELVNNASSAKDLAELRVVINNKNLALPSYMLAPQQFVILCAQEGEDLLTNYGNMISLNNWPALNNTGATIQLLRTDILIDEVIYKDSWYQNTAKKAGGWSLERINPNWTCNTANSWSASIAHRGGTPGGPNSIYDKNYIPQMEVTGAKIVENNIYIGFNVDRTSLGVFNKEDFRIEPGDIMPIAVSWSESSDSLILTLEQRPEVQTLYTLSLKKIVVCGGDLQIPNYSFFQQTETGYNAIVINEILFNPKKEGSDFVELYNRTNLPINLQGWKLGNRILSEGLLIIPPQEFLVLTAEKEKILYTHRNALTDRIHEMPSLPAYPNQQGVVTLFSTTGLVDSLYYNASMHASWINNPKGVSLERQSYEMDSNHPENFKSAATLMGGATPGFQNSTAVTDYVIKNKIFSTSKTVSPDGDGFEDELEINYILNDPGYLINLNIYNEKGRVIKRLIRQESAGSSGKITWNCIDENSKMAPPGHYIYWIEIYRENGAREIFKEAFVLVQKSHHY